MSTPYRFGNWTLKTRDDVIVGQIVDCDLDFPWFVGTFIPTNEYSKYEPYFRELASVTNDEELKQLGLRFDELHQILNEQLMLVVDIDGSVATQFMMNVYDNEAHFRTIFDGEID